MASAAWTLDSQAAHVRAPRSVAVRAEWLAGNVGRLAIGDARDDAATSTALVALRTLGHSDALVIDLRQCRELSPALAALLASSLFDTAPALAGERYIAPGTTPRIEHVELPSRYLEKPVLIVVGPASGRAAVELARNLKRLRRATVVGTSPRGVFLSPNVPAAPELAPHVAHLVALTALRERRATSAPSLSLQAAIVAVRRELESLRARSAPRPAV